MNQVWNKFLNLSALALVVLVSACNTPQAPDFQGVENLKIDVQGMSGARINGDAKFYNPNSKSVTLKGVNVEVSVENKKVKDIEREYDIRAEPNSDFSVPIDVTISLADLNMGLLSTALSMINGEKKKVRYKGKARVQMYGLTFNVPFDYEDEVDIQL
ncbi:MAG: LEA type 2 family protein [Tunicatimonas sp.]